MPRVFVPAKKQRKNAVPSDMQWEPLPEKDQSPATKQFIKDCNSDLHQGELIDWLREWSRRHKRG